jgi:DNA-binding NarL/FixJ family response regulator
VIRVLIADDQPLMRAGFKAVLEATGQIKVVAEAENGEQAVKAAQDHQPDVVLMDIRMPGVDGLEATRRMPQRRVLVLTTFGLDEYIVEALRAGASGFLTKDAPTDELVAAADRFAREVLDPLRDGHTFAAAVEPPPSATPIQRLAAYTGRQV